MDIKDIMIDIDFAGISNRIDNALDMFKRKRSKDNKLIIGTFVLCILIYGIALLLFTTFCPYDCTLKEHSDYAIVICLFVPASIFFIYLTDSFNNGDLNILKSYTIFDMLEYRNIQRNKGTISDIYTYLNKMPGISELVPNWQLISAAYTKKLYVKADMLNRKLCLQFSKGCYDIRLSEYDLRNVIAHTDNSKVIISWDTVCLSDINVA